MQRKAISKKRKNYILEIEDSSDIPFDDTSDDDSVLDGMEKAIAAINERRAEARAKKSRIVVEEPPEDSSSDESVDSGCEQRGAGASKGKKKKKPTKASASRKKNLSKNDILPPRPAAKKVIKKKAGADQNANTKKVMKPSDDTLVRKDTNAKKPKDVQKVGGSTLVLKDVREILDHAKAIKPKDTGIASG